MKKLKFLLFAVAMLLTVCVQAENKPETVANVNPQPVVTMVSSETADVQQVPCSIAIWNQTPGCEFNMSGTFYVQDCERFVNTIVTFMTLIGC